MPFLRQSAPGVIADCENDLEDIEELKKIANGTICLSQREPDYMIIIRYDIDDNINTYHGETGDVIRSIYYYYKPWDVEYLIHKMMPAEAVFLEDLKIDYQFMHDLGERKSCVPFLKLASQYFKNSYRDGYKINEATLRNIEEIETRLFISYDMKKYKNIGTYNRERKRSAKITLKQREYILQRDSYRCFFCGATSDENKLEVNHIIPISLIEKMNLDSKLVYENYNLCSTCFSCNRGKKDYLTTNL